MTKRLWVLLLLGVMVLGGVSLAQARLMPGDIDGLAVGEHILQPYQMNSEPIGHQTQESVITGFAFAPGRPELAYTALEQNGSGWVAVLRVVNVKQLWPEPRLEKQVVTQPDGSKFETTDYVMRQATFAERERELLRAEATSRPILNLSGPIQWSPDGSKMLVRSPGLGSAPVIIAGKLPSNLWLVDYASGKKQAITQNADVAAAEWSPDSQSIAYTVLTGQGAGPNTPSYGTWLYNLQDGKKLRMYGEVGQGLHWLSNTRLRFRNDAPKELEYDLTAGKLTKLPSPARKELPLPWTISPGKRFYANLQERSNGKILEVRTLDNDLLRLSMPAKEFGGWSSDGRALAYFNRFGALQLAALTGHHKGKPLTVTGEATAQINALQTPVQWSGLALLPEMPSSSPRQVRQGMSWLAMIVEEKLQVFMLVHRAPNFHEAAALGLLKPEQEREIVQENMKLVAQAVDMYMNDWDNVLPPKQFELNKAVDPYTPRSDVFERPGYPGTSAFRYLGNNNIWLGHSPDTWEIVKAYQTRRFGNMPGLSEQQFADTPIGLMDYFAEGGYVIYADRHIAWVNRKDIPAIEAKAQEIFGPAPNYK